jgi:hypothetical protein
VCPQSYLRLFNGLSAVGSETSGRSAQTLHVPVTKRTIERKRRIEDIWSDMNKETGLVPPGGSSGAGGGGGRGDASKKAKGPGKKAQGVLAGIFGKETATKLLTKSENGQAPAAVAPRKLPSVSKVTVTEKYKYAGKEIE